MYSNTEILAAVIVEWAKPMLDEIVSKRMGQLQAIQVANEWVRKYFPVSPGYSIVNDLSFLAVPASEMVIEPFIKNGVAKLGIQDSDVPAYAAKLVDSLMEEAKSKGCVSLFNTIEIEMADLDRLDKSLKANLPVENPVKKYKVKK